METEGHQPVSAPVRYCSCLLLLLLQVLMHYFQPEDERRRNSTLHELLMEEFAKSDELLEMQVHRAYPAIHTPRHPPIYGQIRSMGTHHLAHPPTHPLFLFALGSGAGCVRGPRPDCAVARAAARAKPRRHAHGQAACVAQGGFQRRRRRARCASIRCNECVFVCYIECA